MTKKIREIMCNFADKWHFACHSGITANMVLDQAIAEIKQWTIGKLVEKDNRETDIDEFAYQALGWNNAIDASRERIEKSE